MGRPSAGGWVLLKRHFPSYYPRPNGRSYLDTFVSHLLYRRMRWVIFLFHVISRLFHLISCHSRIFHLISCHFTSPLRHFTSLDDTFWSFLTFHFALASFNTTFHVNFTNFCVTSRHFTPVNVKYRLPELRKY